MKTFIHRKYTVDIDRIQIRNIHYNMAVARFLTTTLRLCCALYIHLQADCREPGSAQELQAL